MNIKPLQDWLYIRVQKITNVGKLEIPSAYQKNRDDVEVLAVGPDIKGIKKGDMLIVRPLGMIRHKQEESNSDEMYGFIREEDIIAIITYTKAEKEVFA